MQGHVIKRGSTYSNVVDLPPGPDGKRRQRWTSGFATRKQAQLALAQLVVELGTGTHVELAWRTFEQYLREDWLPASAARVRPSTPRVYRQLLDGDVLPVIGQRRLDELAAGRCRSGTGGRGAGVRRCTGHWRRRRRPGLRR